MPIAVAHWRGAELGLDLSREWPKPLTGEAVQAADVVIAVGCGDACPVLPGTRYLDWRLPDPAARSAGEIRPIRDEIDARVRALLAELLPAGDRRSAARWPPIRSSSIVDGR